MKFIDYRSGSTYGIGCGPISGPYFGEAMFYDNKGNSFFVLMSVMECDIEIAFSDYPMFDIMYNAFCGSRANFNAEIEKAEKLMKSHDYYSIEDYPDDVLQHGFGKDYPGYEKAVNFAVELFRKDFQDEIDEDGIGDLCSSDIDKMDIPFVPFRESVYDDEYDDEEGEDEDEEDEE